MLREIAAYGKGFQATLILSAGTQSLAARNLLFLAPLRSPQFRRVLSGTQR